MTQTPSRHGVLWDREETILALYLYCQIPFAKTRSNNPEVIRLATMLGRTPGSVARKLGNLGACDPALRERGVVGLPHMSGLDAKLWDEFSGHWDSLILETQRILLTRGVAEAEDRVDGATLLGRPSATAKRGTPTFVRVGQDWFRRAVLASYKTTCCVCRIDVPSLLVAAHIIPWAEDEATRLDPANGLCLCALHHMALDGGLMTVSPGYRIHVGEVLRASTSTFAAHAFGEFDRQSITLPDRFWPRPEYLRWHQDNVFEA